MNALPSRFAISIDGTPISEASGNDTSPAQARLGSPAAVFTLNDSRLMCGNWMLARPKAENRSLGPKPVLWFSEDWGDAAKVYPVTAHKDGDAYRILLGSGSPQSINGNAAG